MKYYCNPLNLPYKYQLSVRNGVDTAFREAADPSLIFFKDRYWLFPSMTGGFFTSTDLCSWEFHPFTAEIPIHDYAPDVCVIDGALWFSASRGGMNGAFYHSPDPVHVPFEKVPASFEFWDPHLFQDEDGRLYFFWGCTNTSPIWGVELEKETMKPLCAPVGLIWGQPERHGFERFGEDNRPNGTAPYIEGAWMTKYKGKYYLQYAAPGTEFNVYSDGVYVADTPLGSYQAAPSNPYSFQPGGFITGSGHGSTLKDRDGTYWHADTLRISCTHPYERRLGLWKAGFDSDGVLYCDQRFGDWPRAMDAPAWSDPEWMLLSYGKPVRASSGAHPQWAVDENIRSWWSADDSDPCPQLTLDLEQSCMVHAVQVNFADDALRVKPPKDAVWSQFLGVPRVIEDRPLHTRWLLEASMDGKVWDIMEDKRACDTDLPHDLVVKEEGVQARYIRLTVTELPYHQTARISGLRVFGISQGQAPEKARVLECRRLPLDGFLRWESSKGANACISWGYAPDKLYHSEMVFGYREASITALIKGQPTWVRVDCFNEHGVTRGDVFCLG